MTDSSVDDSATATATPPAETIAALDALIERDQQAVACPYPIFAELRDTAPVFQSETLGAWVVTRYDDIRAVLHDTDRFSSSMPTGPSNLAEIMGDAMAELQQDPAMTDIFTKVMSQRGQAAVLLNADPPDHRRQRKAVNKAFRPARLRGMEPMITEVADALLDDIVATHADGGPVDIVGEFAVGLPMTIIARALGVPDDDLMKFKRWSDDLVMPVGNHSPTVEQVRGYLTSSAEFTDYFGDLLEVRATDPTDDIISDVATASVNDEPLTEAEKLSMLQQFLVAGNETTTKLITNIVHHLASDEDLQRRVRDNRDLIPGFVEEALRFEAPVGGLFRQAKVDVNVGGVTVSAGDHVWVIYAAGNRDEAKFDAPDTFDPCRANVSDHLAFGHGEHFCIGAQLARSEATIATDRILDRFTDIRLAAGNTFSYEDTFVLRGLRSLLVEFDQIASDTTEGVVD